MCVKKCGNLATKSLRLVQDNKPELNKGLIMDKLALLMANTLWCTGVQNLNYFERQPTPT